MQDISEQVKIAYLDVKRAEGDIADYKRAVAIQTENFALFQKRYQQADVSFTEVLIAQQAFILSKANYYTSLINYRINQQYWREKWES